jgi:quercetin dioxygenase-like cupin family protein
MTPTEPNRIAEGRGKRGFSCDRWTDTPGRRWEGFTHATDELVLLLECEMEFEVAGRDFRSVIGEEVLIPAGAVHSDRNVGAATARWLYGHRR